MESNTRLAKPLKPAWAAARLNVSDADLPRLGRPWTRGDVQRLRRERPQWLSDARSVSAARQDADAAYSYLTVARGVGAIDADDAVGWRWRSWFAGDEPDEPNDAGWW